ncbi:MAG: TraB/GumN family protein [Gammaproteobacteria bacterium]|nr:MAG: TraB/GumN family protein [Gammaproteobacteria bacterium]
MSLKVRVLVLLACLMISGDLFAVSTVYEISRGKNKIYLAGTVHLLRSQDFPPPVEFTAAYRQAQKIYFETDIQKSKTPEFGQRFAQAMTLPNNTTLKDVLDTETWNALQAFCTKSEFPLNQTMMFNPAMIGILITLTESKKLGVNDGIDVYYDQLARGDNKNLGELETGDDVIGYMKSFSQEDPNKIIMSTLSDAEHLGDDLGEMIAAWKVGDLDKLQKELGDKMREETPNAYQSLVISRNKKWLPKIEAMFKTPETEMVLVGSLHLPGKDGLLTLLKNGGYKVKPVTTKQG